MSPERVALRAAVDAAVRKRLATEDAKLGRLCAGCGMPHSDLTPGCKKCWDRHRRWRRGERECPYRIDATLHVRALLIASELRSVSHGNRPRSYFGTTS